MPPLGVIGNPGPDLDEPFDQPLDGAPDRLSLDVKLPEHVKQVVGQGPHLEAGMVGPEAVAAGLVPAQGVLPLLDPVLDITPTIVDLHHLRSVEPGVGHDEIDFRHNIALATETGTSRGIRACWTTVSITPQNIYARRNTVIGRVAALDETITVIVDNNMISTASAQGLIASTSARPAMPKTVKSIGFPV